MLAADSAGDVYSCWREYVAAHILGRAIAFGNYSTEDFVDVIDFLLNHDHSPFNDVEFE